MTLSTILERVSRRTITLKEAGKSYESLPGCVKDNPVSFLEGGGVVTILEKWADEVGEEVRAGSVNFLPDVIGYGVGAGGGRA